MNSAFARLSRLATSKRHASGGHDSAARWRAAEQALRDSEERFRLAALSATDVVFEWNTTTGEIFLFGDPQGRLGFAPEDLPRTYEAFVAVIHPEDRARVLTRIQETLGSGSTYAAEYRVVTKDGSVRHWSANARMLPSANPARLIGVVTDITDRVEAQQRIADMNAALRGLSVKLLRAEDEERRRFARELHDSTAQSLTAISFSLQLLCNAPELASAPTIRNSLEDCAALVEGCIREVRTLSHLLHPILLDDLGLEPALRNFVSGFERRTGLRVRFESSGGRRRWPQSIESTAFRFVQEALSNVHRHAEATEVEVHAAESGGVLRVRVRDNGRGFPPQSFDERGRLLRSGVGIAGMRERARLAGGDLVIQSTPQGSTLEIVIPIHETD